MVTIYANTDHVLTLHGLADAAGSPVDEATVSAALLDAEYAPVVESPWPLKLADQGQGDYRGLVPHDTVFDLGGQYFLQLTAAAGGLQSVWYLPLAVTRRVV